MYETRAYDNEAGDPVVVIVATGTHDVSRLTTLLNGGAPSTEQHDLAEQVTRQVRRRHGGRAALALLAEHGGPDLLTPVGDTKPMFDIAADVPDIAEDGPTSATAMVKAFAARAVYALRFAHETFPADDHPDRPAALRRARDHYHVAQYLYGVVFLLRALMKHAPGQADEIAAQLWQHWYDGDASEWISDWLSEWGIDNIDEHIVKAIDDARAAASDLLSADEVAIRAELAAQDAKWGEQNHPNGTGPNVAWGLTGRASFLADLAKGLCERYAKEGRLTWLDILLEEVAEAFAENDQERLDAELLQVAAIAVQWRRALRRSALNVSAASQEEASANV
ncbi:hypothetical protein [Nonomuraea sp. NPDC050202]|uniref:hypothetical protein n=1 Tax=Nonomuraea sp. NPDC050202 TaxID=3155035 RepID=UPI0033E46AE4